MRILSPRHLAWIRKHYCCVRKQSGYTCQGPEHAHHVRDRTDGGMGLKPGDQWTVPLCEKHHREIHAKGHKTFCKKYDVDLRKMAEGYAQKSEAIQCQYTKK